MILSKKDHTMKQLVFFLLCILAVSAQAAETSVLGFKSSQIKIYDSDGIFRGEKNVSTLGDRSKLVIKKDPNTGLLILQSEKGNFIVNRSDFILPKGFSLSKNEIPPLSGELNDKKTAGVNGIGEN